MSWERWSYNDWNSRLLQHHLASEPGKMRSVQRIPASAEELLRIVGDMEVNSDQVVGAFVAAVKRTLPRGTSFLAFCENYRGWNTSSSHGPPFFAMLWFTCLVAHGYPDGEDGFHARMERVLGKAQQHAMSCLPKLWKDLSVWTERQARLENPRYRRLVLPEPCTFRTNIGYSWFLAFPHRDDKDQLERLLRANDMLGEDLPILSVLAALKSDKRFSRSFREDLANFEREFLQGAKDLRKSPFWIAVQQAALHEDAGVEAEGLPTILALHDDKILPYVACSPTARLPEGYTTEALEIPVGKWTHYVLAPQGSDLQEKLTNAAVAAFAGELLTSREVSQHF